MKLNLLVLAAMFALVLSAVMMPAMADDAGEVVLKDAGNTEELTCCEKCGCDGGEKTLGDLLLVGIAMMGLATLSATRK